MVASSAAVELLRARSEEWRAVASEGRARQRAVKAAQGACRNRARQLAVVQRRTRGRQAQLRAAQAHLTDCCRKSLSTAGARKRVVQSRSSFQENSQAEVVARRALRAAKAERRTAVCAAQAAISRRDGAHARVKLQALKLRQSQAKRKAEARRTKRLKAIVAKHEALRKQLAEQQRAAAERLEVRLQEEVSGMKRKVCEQRREEDAKRKRRATSYATSLREGTPLHADKFQQKGASTLSSEDEAPNLSGRVSTLMPRNQKHEYTLVYLHQFALDGASYMDWKPHYFFSSTKLPRSGVKVVLPTAKCIAITAHEGTKQYAWYDYKTDFDGEREDEIAAASLRATRDRIFRILDREVERLGGDASRVFIGGASQGCCTALHCAMKYPRRLGGFVGVVGHLLTATPVPASKKDMPIYLLNTREDKVMRWSWVQKTYRRFKDAGFKNLHIKVVEGTHYKLSANERQWILTFLSKVL